MKTLIVEIAVDTTNDEMTKKFVREWIEQRLEVPGEKLSPPYDTITAVRVRKVDLQ